MIKLFGVAVLTVMVVSAVAGANPSRVLVSLVKLPSFQIFMVIAFGVVGLLSLLERHTNKKQG